MADSEKREIGVDGPDKYSLRGRVYQRIRDDILEGKYKEHEELKEVAIGEELGVSRTPVREALRQLELEGLVTIVPNKGAYVTGITTKDVADIYQIRSKLEGLAARWACEKITSAQMDEMEECIYLSEFHATKGHREIMAQMDNRFHEVLYEACDSKMLQHLLRDFHQYVLRIRRKTLSGIERSKESTQEHRMIMEAIKAHDGDLAEELANKHIINAYENMIRQGLNVIGDEGEEN